jgi:peptidoglycan/xylan/chitin deacetylase (PgdA/CDA1 family)
MKIHKAGDDLAASASWRDLAFRLMMVTRVPRFFTRQDLAADSLKVLVYHDVLAHDIDRFRRQMEFIKSRYRFVSAADVAAGDIHGIRGGSSVLLTFDDGFLSNRLVAETVLDPLGIKAVFFIPGQILTLHSKAQQLRFVRHQLSRRSPLSSLPAHSELMRTDDLRALVANGHTIGAHGWSHTALTSLGDQAALEAEIVRPGDELAAALGTPIDWFAYPFGLRTFVNERVYAMIKRRYRFCCTSVRGTNSRQLSAHSILRDTVESSMPTNVLSTLLEGGLDWAYRRDAAKVAKMASTT